MSRRVNWAAIISRRLFAAVSASLRLVFERLLICPSPVFDCFWLDWDWIRTPRYAPRTRYALRPISTGAIARSTGTANLDQILLVPTCDRLAGALRVDRQSRRLIIWVKGVLLKSATRIPSSALPT